MNLQNRTIFCRDNLDVLEGINSESIDLIYLDPPFNKKKIFSAPIGSRAEGASFKDLFFEEDVKEEWLKTIREDNDKLHAFLESLRTIEGRTSYNFCYLAYMAVRLMELHRILKDTGSLYLHCDPTMSHYLKILMDMVFGEKNFRNEIIWHYKNASRGKKRLARAHDILFWYAKDYKMHLFYKENILVPFESEMTQWRYTKGGQKHKKTPEGKVPDDVITMPSLNTMSKERVGYPTQKPLKLLERIISASSNEGDMVLDPFCGCATTCVASEKLGRQWVGVDVSVKTYELVRERLEKEVKGITDDGQIRIGDWNKVVRYTTIPPKRSDTNLGDRLKKYVYVISNASYPGEYKVGIAKDMKARLNSYQTSDPNRAYQLELTLHTHAFRELKKLIHERFESRHEWIIARKEDIIKAMKTYAASKP